MVSRLLFVTVQSIEVAALPETADHPDANAHHALVATLSYPRSGAPSITSTLPLETLHTGTNTLAAESDFGPLILKERVEGSRHLKPASLLGFALLRAHKDGGFGHVVRTVCATAIGAGLSVATGGLGAVVGSVSGLGVTALKGAIVNDGTTHNTLLGHTSNILIDLDTLSDTPQTRVYPLILSEPIVTRRAPQLGDLVIQPGANGSVSVRIWAEPAES